MLNKRGKGRQPKPASEVEDYELYCEEVDNAYEFELPEEEDDLLGGLGNTKMLGANSL